MDPTLPKDVAYAVGAYLRSADQLLPGAVTACAVGGSIALDAYRPGRSDIDVIAVLSDEWKGHRSLMARLRLLHLSQVPRLTALLPAVWGSAPAATPSSSGSPRSRSSHPDPTGRVPRRRGLRLSRCFRRQSGDLEGTRRRRHLHPRRPCLGLGSRPGAR